MYKTQVQNGAPYVAAMAIRYVAGFCFLFVHEYLIADCVWFASFSCAITVVAWSSFIQVESKILEKQGSKSVGCREAFRRRTAPVFAGAVVLFGLSVASFVYAFSIIGYIKPCAQTHPKPAPNLQSNTVLGNLMLSQGFKQLMSFKPTSFGSI